METMNLKNEGIDYVVIRKAKFVEYGRDSIAFTVKDGRKFKVTVKEL